MAMLSRGVLPGEVERIRPKPPLEVKLDLRQDLREIALSRPFGVHFFLIGKTPYRSSRGQRQRNQDLREEPRRQKEGEEEEEKKGEEEEEEKDETIKQRLG